MADFTKTLMGRRITYASNPDNIDKASAAALATVMPGVKVPNRSDYATLLDAFEAQIPADHPTKGAGYQFRDVYKKLIAHPGTLGYSPEQMSQAVMGGIMRQGEEQGGGDRLTRSYAYKWHEDSEFFGDEVKEPMSYGRESYGEWHQTAMAYGRQKEAESGGMLQYAKNVGTATLIGAAAGSVLPVGGTILGGALAGAAALGATEILATPYRRQLRKSEWYQSKTSPFQVNDSGLDTAAAVAAEYGPELAIGIGAEFKLARLFSKAKTAGQLLAKPNVAGLIEYGKQTRKINTLARSPEIKNKMFERVKKFYAGREFGLNEKEVNWWKRLATRGKKGDPYAKKDLNELADMMVSDITKKGSKDLSYDILGRNMTPKDMKGHILKAARDEDDLIRALNNEDGPVTGFIKMIDEDSALNVFTNPKGAQKEFVQAGKLYDATVKAVQSSKIPTDKIPVVARNYIRSQIDKAQAIHTLGPLPNINKAIKYNPPAVVKQIETRAVQIAREEAERGGVEALKGKGRAELFRATAEAEVVGKKQLENSAGKTLSEAATDVGNWDEIATGEWIAGRAMRKSAKDAGISKSTAKIIEDVNKSTGKVSSDLENGIRLLAKGLGATLPVGMATLLFATDADASGVVRFLSSVAKGFHNVKQMPAEYIKIVKAMHADKYVTKEVGRRQMRIQATDFQRGLPDDPTGKHGAEGFMRLLRERKLYKDVDLSSKRYQHMSPHAVLNEILNIKEKTMMSPAVFRASYMMAEYSNIRKSTAVLSNMFRDAGVKSEVIKVRDMFAPVIPHMMKQVKFEHSRAILGQLKKEEAKILADKGIPKSLKRGHLEPVYADREAAKAALEEARPGVESFHKEWASVASRAAKDIPSVRVALAVGDTADFAKYPFLKNTRFTREEGILIGRLKAFNQTYKKRLEEINVPVIEGPYLHHAFHPKVTKTMLEELSGKGRAGALKFYSRSRYSRPMLPDINTTMLSYASKTERRIQDMAFWNSGWKAAAKATEDIPAFKAVFDNFREGIHPAARTWGNKAAEHYAQIEAMKRLFLAPSAGLKHLFKATGDIVSAGFGETAEALPMTAVMLERRIVRSHPWTKRKLAKVGITGNRALKKYVDSMYTSMIPMRNTHQRLLDMGVDAQDVYFNAIKKGWNRAQDAGSSWINLAELADRGLAVNTALMKASKRGMTTEQAIYGAYDMILRNNFLSREFSPAFLRNPKIRASFMFQTTPFKMAERRIVNAIRSGRVVKGLTKQLYELSKTPAGREKLLAELKNIRAYVKKSEHAMKSNLFIDTIRQEVDFFGGSALSQFAKDTLIVGAATIGGHHAGVNIFHHFMHAPFISPMHDFSDPKIAYSPGYQAILRGTRSWWKREEEDSDFLFLNIAQKWMGPAGPFPDPWHKVKRINKRDIPDRYKESPFLYLFSIPAHHERPGGKH